MDIIPNDHQLLYMVVITNFAATLFKRIDLKIRMCLKNSDSI